jgi:hypothetical protein
MNTLNDQNAVGIISNIAGRERLVDVLPRNSTDDEGRLVFVHDGYMIDFWLHPDADLTIWQVAEMLSFERIPVVASSQSRS